MRSKVILSCLLVNLFSCLATAQTQVQPPIRPYHVLSYNLLMDWRNVFEQQSLIFSGHNQIDIVVTGTTSAIVLDASEMTIDSIRMNGQLISTPGIVADTIAIPLPSAEQAIGTQLSLSIYYTHTIDTIDPQSGMFFYPKGTPSEFSSGTIPEDIAYTMSEPDGARKWMPCNDEPYNKANSDISVIVPSGYTAQSNGTLLSIDTDLADGSRTFNWMSDRPIVTYLMAAYASKWVEWHDEYHRLSNPNDSVPVNYYAWQEDYDGQDTTGNSFNARFAFRNTPKMIENDSRLFGEFPFSQYSQVPLDSFYFGGMEHQSITALYRGVLYGTDESVIAHELFHQWFGDKTTCETWADIWLNEGFARFGEMLWAEASGGEKAYDNYLQSVANEFFQVNLVAPTYAPPVDQMFNWPYVAVVYDKPSCTLHMLRRVLNNDTVFFNTLRDYSSAFAYTTANTFQFRDFLATRDSAVAPMDLKEFINEWIFQPDWPVYTIRWALFGNSLYLQVDQTQTTTDHYTMPLRFKGIGQNDTLDLTFLNNARSQSFTTPLPHAIQNLIFDTNAVILSQISIRRDQSLSVAPVNSKPQPLQVILLPGQVELSYAPIVNQDAVLRITDVLGRVIVERTLATGSSRMAFSTNVFVNGDYFATISDGVESQSAKFHFSK